ncbi:MAG: 30S ribosome-binding factor RbfA [Candidatus Izemoplasmatales bacterium]|mgnify:CR=1 FL=1|jgi:ribosome-binding factor A|nr:30S ribosome-binding factor RbfA [Candidatus Izemoplasmatales bacterium]MDD5602427.1 30S ribosome-binding factor RbfA [Candidatus Izemoplasmatales bacterium]MDY0373363.1 30S ribosome-binding factor RbfA [Candidatus Izemoplasmatales bacterium]NLF48058.1 30S ribosome-binding factor RbfA [Acholeplasmataceae bacterium]
MPKSDRLETLVQRAFGDIVQNEIKDALGFMTVTDVKITNELSYMTIFYTVLGDEKAKQKTVETLERAKGFIKNQIAKRVKMRKVPELLFKYDTSLDKGEKIDRLIRDIH